MAIAAADDQQDGGGSDLLLAVGALGVRALSPRVYLYARTAGAYTLKTVLACRHIFRVRSLVY